MVSVPAATEMSALKLNQQIEVRLFACSPIFHHLQIRETCVFHFKQDQVHAVCTCTVCTIM